MTSALWSRRDRCCKQHQRFGVSAMSVYQLHVHRRFNVYNSYTVTGVLLIPVSWSLILEEHRTLLTFSVIHSIKSQIRSPVRNGGLRDWTMKKSSSSLFETATLWRRTEMTQYCAVDSLSGLIHWNSYSSKISTVYYLMHWWEVILSF